MIPGDISPDAQVHDLSGCCQTVLSIVARIGDKWAVLVIIALARGPKRFNQLKREIGGISQRMLTLTLRGLERDGFVLRTQFPTVPPRVDYELSDLGRSIQDPVLALGNWARTHMARVEEARARYDKAAEPPV